MAISRAERTKDTVQVVVESGASHLGRIAGIVSGAALDVTREFGEFATDIFEMREASRLAAAEQAAADAEAALEDERRVF